MEEEMDKVKDEGQQRFDEFREDITPERNRDDQNRRRRDSDVDRDSDDDDRRYSY